MNFTQRVIANDSLRPSGFALIFLLDLKPRVKCDASNTPRKKRLLRRENLKRGVTGNEEEFDHELCALCDSAFLPLYAGFLDSPDGPNRHRTIERLSNRSEKLRLRDCDFMIVGNQNCGRM